MAKEHVEITVGANTSFAEKAMVGLKDKMNGWAGGLKDTFKGIGAGFAGAFAAGAIMSKIKDLGQMAKEVMSLAETFGVSEEFAQSFRNQMKGVGKDAEVADMGIKKLALKIGDARTGSESAIKTFQKWNISLVDANGNAKNTEEVMRDVADRMLTLEDGTLAAAMAYDLMGKRGAELVDVLRKGSGEMEKAKHSWKVFTHEDLQTLSEIWAATKKIGSALTYGIAKPVIAIVNGFKYLAQVLGAISGGGNIATTLAEINQHAKNLGKSVVELNNNPVQIVDKEEIKKAQELEQVIKRLLELSLNHDFDALTEEQKLIAMKAEQRDLSRKLLQTAYSGSAFQEPGFRGLELDPLAQAQASLRLEELKKGIKDQELKIKRAETEEDRKQWDYARSRLAAMNAAQSAKQALQITKEDRSKFTLAELAAMNPRRFQGNLRDEVYQARDVQDLEAEAERLKSRGFFKESQEAFNRADKIRSGLIDLKDNERFPFKSMEKSLAEANEALKAIKETGIPVKPEYGN